MKKAMILFLAIVCGITMLSGCSKDTETEVVKEETKEEHAVESTVNLTKGKYSDEKLDAAWDEKEAVRLQFDEDKIRASDSSSVRVKENVATIFKEGTYVLKGTLADGQVVVDVADKGDTRANVKLVLNGVDITCSGSAPIYVKSGDTIITLAEKTENVLTDGTEYVFEGEENNEPQAAVFAQDDLTFNGTGSLTVNGNYNHAIQCKDDLKFVTGTFYIMAVGDGIVGKDSVSVRNGNFTIDAGGDGIKSTNVEETDKGYVLIENGAFQITSGNDGIQAETLLRVNDGEFEIVSGGGSDNAVMKQGMGGAPNTGRKEGFGGREVPGGEMPGGEMPGGEMPGGEMPDGERPGREMPGGEMPNGEMPERERPEGNFEQQGEAGGPQENLETEVNDGSRQSETTSAKGLKSYVELVVEGGEFEINSCDDAVHSNKNTTIDGGKFQILSGDDGIHADKDLDVKGGTIDIQQSYEGLEGFDITISGGDIKLVSSDDGINAAGDDDSAESAQAGGQMMSKEDQGASLTIGGGIIYVNAEGDGLDANGDIVISGGTIVVHGPSNGGNGTLDYANRCQITGGTFLGAGSIGMALSPSEDSTQPVITQSLERAVEAGTEISVKDSMGTVIASITTEKRVQWLSVSTPELVKGQKYTVCLGEEEQEVLAE